MRKTVTSYITLILIFALSGSVCAQKKQLKLVFIRHAEKPASGNNLSCQGLNRSMMLPAVLAKKFGEANYIYIPALKLGNSTSWSRMMLIL